MHFARYWTTAKRGGVSAWGWSDESVAQAESKAAGRLSGILDRLARGAKMPVQRYGYADRPMREEVLKEFRAATGTLRAAVTRNSYGCLVLNTCDLMFVDVDAPEAKGSSLLAGLFGFRRPEKKTQPEDFATSVMSRVHQWLTRRPDWGWRVYRTGAGVRLMATRQPITPDDATCKEAFDAFESDPLYRRMCINQKCFRARLMPKPWRCGMDKPSGRWPWASEKVEARFREWEARYLSAAKDYATCKLLGQHGNKDVDPAFMELVQFHDEITRAQSEAPLA